MKKTEIIIFSFLILFYFFWFALPVAIVGTDDLRMVDAFNVDESEFLQLIKNEVKSFGFNMRAYYYSHLYFNTGLLFLNVADCFFDVSEKQIIIFFRLISSLYFIGTCFIIFLIGKKFFGKITAWLSLILLLITPSNLFAYSAMFHPDTAQLFFISLSIFFCLKYFDACEWKNLVFASFFAGFAFGTKYAGIMLMPVIVGIDIFQKPKKPNQIKLWIAFFFCGAAAVLMKNEWIESYVPFNKNSENFFLLVEISRFCAIGAGSIILGYVFLKEFFEKQKFIAGIIAKLSNVILFTAIFLIAFAISSPGCVRGLNFINGFIMVTDLARYGHWFTTSLGFSGWLGILLSNGVLNYAIFVLFAASIFIRFFIFKERKKIYYILICTAWVMIYFTTLVLRVNAEFSHYLIPVIPFIILLSAFAVENILIFIKTKIPAAYYSTTVIIIPVLIFGAESFQSVKEIYRVRNIFINKVENSDAVKAGFWLKENFPAETKILYDRYAYIPVEFNICFSSWGITQMQIRETMPKLIFLNSDIYKNYLNNNEAGKYLWGEEEYMAKYNAYNSILSGNSEYKLLKDFGKIKIFSTDKEWKKNIIYRSENKYEFLAEKWTYDNVVFDSLNVFSEKKSEKLTGEYSATFSTSLHEIFGDTIPHPAYFSALVKAYFAEGTQAILVIDFSHNDKSVLWQGHDFNKVLFPKEKKWNEVSFSRQVPTDAAPEDLVKIYVWNNGNKSFYIDDFLIEAYRYE